MFVKPHLIFVYDGFWVREKRLTRKHYFAKLQFFVSPPVLCLPEVESRKMRTAD